MLFIIIIGGILVLFMYITRLASNEIFSPSNKIHREVGRAKDLSAPLYTEFFHQYFSSKKIVLRQSLSSEKYLALVVNILVKMYIFFLILSLPPSHSKCRELLLHLITFSDSHTHARTHTRARARAHTHTHITGLL